MNEDLLRGRLERAVADVHPVSRLDEITSRPRRPANRGPQILAVAAVVVVLASIAAIVIARSEQERSVVTNQPPTSTSTTADREPTVGEAVRIPTRLLPDGFQVIAERDAEATFEEIALPYTVVYLARSQASYDEGGPAIRVALLPDRFWVDSMRSIVATESDPDPDYGELMAVDERFVPPGTDELLPPDDDRWRHRGRSVGIDALILVDGRDVDLEVLESIATEAMPSG